MEAVMKQNYVELELKYCGGAADYGRVGEGCRMFIARPVFRGWRNFPCQERLVARHAGGWVTYWNLKGGCKN